MEGLSEGLLSMGMHYALGKEYNVAGRYGPGASTSISAMLKDDKGWEEIALGASGSILKDIWKTTYPFQYKAASVFGSTTEYPIKSSDWMSFFRTLAVVDIGAKAIGAAAYGKWYTKSGSSIGDADTMDAAMTVLGLTPQDLANSFLKNDMIKGVQKQQDVYKKTAMENWKLGLQAYSAGDTKGGEEYFKRANTAMQAGDFNMADQAKMYSQGMKQFGDFKDKVNFDMLRKSPASQYQNQLDTFLKGQK
jgi:hypothetical protein